MRILAAVDGSRAAMQAARYAAELARATGGSVVLARAVSEAVARSRAYPARPPEDPVLHEARDELRSVGVPIEARQIVARPGEAITNELKAEAYDLATLGSRGKGESGSASLFLGSTALEVIRKARVPILVVRATEMGDPAGGEKPPRISTLLVPTDGSLASLSAADLGASLADALGAQATLLHVHPPRTPRKAGQAEAEILRTTAEAFTRRGVGVQTMAAAGDPSSAILRVAREGPFDLILMGTYGAGEAWQYRMRMGSVAETVLTGAPCPVILVKHEVTMELDGGVRRHE
ncbi:MAG TPA: universal stress protein [Armatimonadota bacterium]|nr:universal stress protein [Armatimonadota bacterium]HPO73611.1 universal stress protein [Armatimonadota bacterium]